MPYVAIVEGGYLCLVNVFLLVHVFHRTAANFHGIPVDHSTENGRWWKLGVNEI